MNRRQFLFTGAGALFASISSVCAYTRFLEPHWVELVGRELDVAGLPRPLEGKKLVHISDLHVGPYVDDAYLVEVFRKIGKINPDLIALTGDFVSYRNPGQILQLKRILKHFPEAKSEAIAVLGNHDYGPAWSSFEISQEVTAALREAGITVLRNEVKDIEGMCFVGIDDLWAGRFSPERAFRDWNADQPAVVLCHNPDALDHPGWGPYEGWILAGHTHGGQCKPPFLGPPVLPVRNKRYSSGEVLLPDGRNLYVNRGIGHLLEVRFNVRPEVTVFTLTRQHGGRRPRENLSL